MSKWNKKPDDEKIVARFNSSRVDSTYECQTPQNATLTDQERQEDVQLKVC